MMVMGAAMSQSQTTQAISQNSIQLNPILNIFSDAAEVNPNQTSGGTNIKDSGATSKAEATAKPSVSSGFGEEGGGSESGRSGYLPTSFVPSNLFGGSRMPGADPDMEALYSESIAGVKAQYIGDSAIGQSLNPMVLVGGALVVGAAVYFLFLR